MLDERAREVALLVTRSAEDAVTVKETICIALRRERERALQELQSILTEHRYIRDGGVSCCRCALQFNGQSWDEDWLKWWKHILKEYSEKVNEVERKVE